MTKISQFPTIVGVYQLGHSDLELNIAEDIETMEIKFSEQVLEALINAVKKGAIAQLPEGFQGRRSGSNPDIIELYTTRKVGKKTSV
ncbi:hypothetical protein LAT59_03650 [Candidatus Gracilibacteria bacterium]|nr:hypothetical protein [Candidatus Gracilibacteria bacterium]